MALKGDRYEFMTDISYFMNSAATRGGIVVAQTVGSGAALDQSQALVQYASNPSGMQPVGALLTDVVNLDLTRQHINFHRDEVQIGGKVTLLKKGWLVTNNIIGTPSLGDNAYLTSSGSVMPLNPYNTSATNFKANGAINVGLNPLVGKFLSTMDEDGYAKLQVEL